MPKDLCSHPPAANAAEGLLESDGPLESWGEKPRWCSELNRQDLWWIRWIYDRFMIDIWFMIAISWYIKEILVKSVVHVHRYHDILKKLKQPTNVTEENHLVWVMPVSILDTSSNLGCPQIQFPSDSVGDTSRRHAARSGNNSTRYTHCPHEIFLLYPIIETLIFVLVELLMVLVFLHAKNYRQTRIENVIPE